MSALDFLARATWMLAEQERRSFSRKEDVPIVEEPFGWAVRRCREEGLPVRRIVWSGDEGRFRSPGKTEWLESRWPVSTAGAELVITVGLSQNGRRTTLPALRWWLTSVRSFGGLVASQGDEASPSRSVRFHVVRKGDSLGKPGLTGLYDRVRIHEVEVCHGSDGGVRLVARGFLAVLLAYFATGAGTLDVQWVPPIGTLRIACRGPEGPSLSARLVVAAALWWRLADLSSLFPLFSWATPQMADMCLREAESHPLKPCLGAEAVRSHVLEARLKEIWQLSRIFSETTGAEDEVAGWCREIEAALRQRAASFVSPAATPGPRAPLSWLPSAGTGPQDAASPYIARRDRSGTASDRAKELADGERSLVEIALRLAVEGGMDFESAVQLAHRWSREGWIAPLRRRLETRTLLYFSYGSCMCRPSFRETVPRFELIGEAVLREFRLAYTRRSAGRGGGVADLVPDPGGEVRGVLYRIPQVFLRDLDEREGVYTGHYQRMRVAVEALGVPYDDVLTYTVVNKAAREIPPSPEYAGLIVDGARGILADAYVATLEALFEEWGVEPEMPL